VRYVPQLKRNLIFVGALEALGLEIYIRDEVLKMVKCLMVVLKGVQCNKLYYLKGSMVTGCNAPIPSVQRHYCDVYT